MPACLECGRRSRGPRCAGCEKVRPIRDSTAEQRINRGVVRRWVERWGWWCPGWETKPHTVNAGELTVEHDPPLSTVQDPAAWQGDRTVLCRSCNSRKGTRS